MDNFPDEVRLDDPMGPEFSIRIMNVCAMHDVHTVGQLRNKLPELERWRGLGSKSIKEIRDFYRRLDATQKNLFNDPDYVRYRLEDAIGSIEALLQDVQRTLTRVALKGRVSGDTRRDMIMKLTAAAEAAQRLPTQGEEG